MSRALEDLQAGWTLKGDQLPWNVSDPFRRMILRATLRVVCGPGPLPAHARQMADAEIRNGRWQGSRPDWVDPRRVAAGWWVGTSQQSTREDRAAPFVLLNDEVVATGPVLRRRRRRTSLA